MNDLEIPDISANEWFSLNQFLRELEQIHSECVSVYYPYGRGQETINLLQKTKRKPMIEKIESSIEQRINKLKTNPSSVGKFTKTLCIFGYMKNNQVSIKEIGTSKSLPYIYMVNKSPYLKPFNDILKTSYGVLLVVLDQKSAKLQKFHGSHVVEESKLSIDLRGRHKKGGQSQGRFLRARQTKIHVFFKKVAKKIKQMGSDSELILLGGSGNAKIELFDQLHSNISKKCQIVDDLTFSTPKEKIYKKIIQHLSLHRKKLVEELLENYDEMVKENLTAKNNSVIAKALRMGAVDTLIVSADYHTKSQYVKITKMLEAAKKTSAVIEFALSSKIIKKLDLHDSVLAILRFRIK